MKKVIALFFLLQLVLSPVVYAEFIEDAVPINPLELHPSMASSAKDIIEEPILKETSKINSQTNQYPPAPKWEDFVPAKYQNPRTDFSKKSTITELTVGIITAPFGVPLICHATTKLKNIGYADKKVKFEQGLYEAQRISIPSERVLYYYDLLKKCDFPKWKYKNKLREIEKTKKQFN